MTLTEELNQLVTGIAGITFKAVHDGRVIVEEDGFADVLDADEAIEFALELAILHDDVVANPGDYHLDTLAAHGVMVPQDHPQRAEIVPPCAAGISADCTGEGTAHMDRCLPCDLDLAADEEARAATDGEWNDRHDYIRSGGHWT